MGRKRPYKGLTKWMDSLNMVPWDMEARLRGENMGEPNGKSWKQGQVAPEAASGPKMCAPAFPVQNDPDNAPTHPVEIGNRLSIRLLTEGKLPVAPTRARQTD